MAENSLTVSVIVPVWNRPDDIRRCLASLQVQTLPSSEFEVIVVDNGSTDDTADAAQAFPGVTVLSEPRPGSYAARNLGLSVARGRLIAFIDSDCSADPRWLEEAVRAAAAFPAAGVIAGHIELRNDGGESSATCEAYERFFAFNQQRNVANGIAVTANWLSSAALLQAFGGFRADLKSGGDVDLAKRIRAAGHDIAYAPAMIVTHPARVTLADLTGKTRRVTGGRMASRKVRGGALGWGWIVARDTGYRIRSVWRSADPGALMKIRLSGLLLLLLAVALAEIGRIASGGKARRT